MSNRVPVYCVGTGIDRVLEAARVMAATQPTVIEAASVGIDIQDDEVIVHKTASVGWSDTIIPYEIRPPMPDLSGMVQWQNKIQVTGRPKRNKSKLKQQRKSRRRNRC